jgi:hypothetical protein
MILIVFGEKDLESILFKQLIKIIVIVSIPISIILLFLYGKPVIAIAYLLGVFLAGFHLKTLFEYFGCILNVEVKNSNTILLMKYIFSSILNLIVMIITLYKSHIVGFPIIFGIITVPIIITFFALGKGISLYRNS